MTRSSRNRLPHDEQGIAMITALLVMMVLTVVLTASIALAVHANGQSANQRNQTAALHAADYGLHEQLASLAGQPSIGGATCTPIAPTLLPDSSLPAEWFSVTMPGCVASSPTRTIIATGYALGAGTNPPANPPATAFTRSVVAHITLQPAGAVSSGGYGFPDAILTLKGAGAGQTGALTASSNPLTVSGLGGYPSSIRADGPVTLSGGQLNLSSGQAANSLSSWDNITLTNTPVSGNVASAKTVNLNSSNVSGSVEGSTVNLLGSPPSSVGTYRNGTVKLPTQPPVPLFPSPADPGWANWLALTGGSVQSACPAGGTLSGLYVLSASCSISPSAVAAGPVAVIVNAAGAANLTVNLPSYLGSGPSQLYLIAANGNLTLTNAGAAVQVFAYGSGTVTVGGTIVGQIVGGNVTTSAATNLIATSLPAVAPDFAFPTGGTGPTPTGFVPQIIDEYLCAPGVAAAC
ncbi:MAG: hypothetical protein QOF81_1494 [Acidimicrobiaceae bacterium]|nr:hypothetical protein [Acidimicrobiaceae bacterium]